jgi:endonuclease/exonuclease/phosphatase family metal-dependent hydrolase
MSDKKPGCIISIIKWLNFLLIILTGISFAAPYFPPTPFWPFIFLGMGFPILIILNMVCVVFWLYMRKWYFILSLMCLIMSWSGAGKFIGNPFKAIPEMGGKHIKVMTFNAQGGNIYQNKLYDEFAEVVLRSDPDIICFQEINIKVKKFQPVRDKYPYVQKKQSQSILSKYPIQDSGDLELEKIRTSNGAIWADINVDGQIVRVYNLHLHSNRISLEVDELSENTELNELNDKAKWNATKGILSQVRDAAAVRANQSIKIKESLNNSPSPVILCGDFNDPPQSYSYRILAENLKDSFEEAGRGFGFTYNGNIPFLKIDYILSSPEIGVSSTKIIKSNVSDHKPVVSTLVLPTK